MEPGDRVAFGEPADEAVLIRAINRVREIRLLPQRDVLRAVGAHVDPQNLKWVRDRILCAGVRVEPLQVVDHLRRQVRLHR